MALDDKQQRDYFATAAMNGFIASGGIMPISKDNAKTLAKYSYAVADAMMREREEKQEIDKKHD